MEFMVGTGRLELPTSALSVPHSNQLSYAPVEHFFSTSIIVSFCEDANLSLPFHHVCEETLKTIHL